MKITLARHYGMCFGVRDALRATHERAGIGTVTVLGQLVHNPVVDEQLGYLGVRRGDLADLASAPRGGEVIITAHGAADNDRERWRAAGHVLTDTTCPLVKKAHSALALLVAKGYHPVVIGKAGHVEVRGLCGDFPEATVVETSREVSRIGNRARIGIVSQTTQPIERVRELVEQIRECHPGSEVRFIDTVCQPTKDRQVALRDLCSENSIVIVVGGANSNNTGELVRSATAMGARAYRVERPADLRAEWFDGVERVGLTAGTSTLDESVRAVFDRLTTMASEKAAREGGLLARLVG
jgi:4-hydroxy-3-methylbut-2-enyl diphosphate reductase